MIEGRSGLAQWIRPMAKNPMSNKEESLRKVLDGDTDSLWSAFVWDHTPQGADHWINIVDGHASLSEEDRMYICTLLEDDDHD